MAKKPKKPKVPKLKRKAFKLWSLKVRMAYGNKCAICGSENNLNAHHIESRKSASMRFLVENGAALCPLHHKFDSRNSAHNGPVWFHQWLLQNRPKTIDFILLHRDDPVEETVEYMLAVLTKLEQPLSSDELDTMGIKTGSDEQKLL